MSDSVESGKIKEDRPGVLSAVHLNKDERDLVIDYYEKTNPSLNAEFLFVLMDEEWLKFLDVMAGTNIRVPSRDSILKTINYVKIYRYCAQRDFSRESIEKASKLFGRRTASISRIIEKVKRNLTKGELDAD